MKTIKILLFDDIELLDFAGPMEVFCVAAYLLGPGHLDIKTIAYNPEIRLAKSGTKILPEEFMSEPVKTDILIIPGGVGTRQIINDNRLLKSINELIKSAEITASVCTGALILGKLGYLKNQCAITHKGGISELERIDPSITIEHQQRFVDNGVILTAGGISAGIDLSLYLVEKYFSKELMNKTMDYMEYNNSL